jgi:UDP-glucose 4-epimerase
MVVLVTGGAGFIGSNLVEELVKGKEKVTVIDNMHTGSEKNLSEVRGRVEFIGGGIEKTDGLDPKGIEGIYHLGIPSSSPMYKSDPYLVGSAINDMLRILELARKSDCRVVFASSSSVYNGMDPPHREDMEIKVTDYYTEARIAMERLARLYAGLYGVDTMAMRFFSVYGPHEEGKGKYANLVSQFMWCMRKGGCPLIYGDGRQERDFVYVKDVVSACMLAMGCRSKTDIFNVGTGRSCSLVELVSTLNGILGTDCRAEFVENPISNYVNVTRADTKKSERVLGFRPKRTLEKGIMEYK